MLLDLHFDIAIGTKLAAILFGSGVLQQNSGVLLESI
jgi:hypothetical protein